MLLKLLQCYYSSFVQNLINLIVNIEFMRLKHSFIYSTFLVPIHMPDSQNFEPDSQNFEPDSQNFEPVSQNLEPVSQNLEPVSHNLEPISQNLELVSQNLELVSQNCFWDNFYAEKFESRSLVFSRIDQWQSVSSM